MVEAPSAAGSATVTTMMRHNDALVVRRAEGVTRNGLSGRPEHHT